MEYCGEACRVVRARYPSGRVALALFTDQGEPMAKVTVNLPDIPLAADEVVVKDYQENAGMLAWLVDHGVVSAPVRMVRQGLQEFSVCRLLEASA